MPEPVAPFRWIFRARFPIVADVPEPVHDGDTVTLQLDRGIDGTSTYLPLRLQRVFSPEVDDPDPKIRQQGFDVRSACFGWLLQRSNGVKWPFLVETFRTSTDLHSRETLSRYIAEVSTPAGESLNDYLIGYVQQHGYSRGTGG